MVVVLHTHQTLAVVDMHPVQEPKELTEGLSTGWVEARGSPMVVRLEWASVAMEMGTGKEC